MIMVYKTNPFPSECTVAVVGAGPAGLAAAIELKKRGVSDVIVLERTSDAGGTPRFCGHSIFGLREFKRTYFGPAYARKLHETAANMGVEIYFNTTVIKIAEAGHLTLSTEYGLAQLQAERVVLSTGIRETPRAPRFVSGQRPQGIMTTGALQSMVYSAQKKPFKRPLIVGSELVSYSAVATCRHAGIKPVAMLEEASRPVTWSILSWYPKFLGVRSIFDTQLVEIQGKQQVTGVKIVSKGEAEEQIDCDGIIFSGKFLPEASLVRIGHLEMDPHTQGPVVDQFGRCSDPSYFAAGNILRPVETGGWCWSEGVKIATYVSLSLSKKLPDNKKRLSIVIDSPEIKYVVPQKICTADRNLIVGGVDKLQLRFTDSVNGRLRLTSATGVEYLSTRINSRPERRVLLPLSTIIETDLMEDIHISYSAS